MPNLYKFTAIATLLFFMLSATPAIAQSSLIEAENDDVEVLELEQELRFPQVGPKLKSYVTSYMHEIAKDLYRDGYDVETMRNGEVVIAVIPTDDLFVPNESRMLPSAEKIFSRFNRFFSTPAKFKVLIAAHSDDTGSEDYNYNLTESRINAILDYLESQKLTVENATGFPMGSQNPVTDNSNRANRAKNRRIEIYIMPDEGLLAEARSSKK